MVSVSLVLFLSACGGGGSGSGSSTGSQTNSGLVPAAGPIGAVLYSNASVLRPLIDGASWTFHTYNSSGQGFTGFKRVQKATAAGAFIETDSDDPETRTTLTVDAASGQVNMSADLDTGLPIAKLAVNGPELKSPVKANDQIVLLDRHIADIGADIDKDGKNDAMDIAIYRVVVGNETLTLPNRRAPMTALRIDTTTAIRVIPSGGAPATLDSQVQSAWYAAGIGIVRQVLQGATPSANAREDFLLGFDGGTTGWGIVTRSAQLFNDGSASFVPAAQIALPLTNGVLVLGNNAVFQLDSLGKLVARRSYADYGLNLSNSLRWMNTSDGPRILGGARDNAATATAVGLFALNADGSPGTRYLGDMDILSLSPNGVYNSEGFYYGSATSNVIWGMSTRLSVSNGASSATLVLRRFDTRGNAIGGEIALPAVSFPAAVKSQVTASGLLVSWSDITPTSTYTANAQAFVRNDGSVAWQSQIPLPNAIAGPMTPLAGGNSSLWLIWDGQMGFGGVKPQAVSLDANGLPIGVALDSNLFANTQLSLITSSNLLYLWPSLLAVQGNELLVAGSATTGTAFSGDKTPSTFLQMARYDMGAG
ncbi:MAG TPA: hypothetical protein VIN58_04860, partial [Roseateles sp.]